VLSLFDLSPLFVVSVGAAQTPQRVFDVNRSCVVNTGHRFDAGEGAAARDGMAVDSGLNALLPGKHLADGARRGADEHDETAGRPNGEVLGDDAVLVC